MFLLSSWAFEREIIEVERCDHLLARFLAYLLQFVAENYEFATHKHQSLGTRTWSRSCWMLAFKASSLHGAAAVIADFYGHKEIADLLREAIAKEQRLVLEEAAAVGRDACFDVQPSGAGAALDVGDFHLSLLLLSNSILTVTRAPGSSASSCWVHRSMQRVASNAESPFDRGGPCSTGSGAGTGTGAGRS